jgi:hypothetical protein
LPPALKGPPFVIGEVGSSTLFEEQPDDAFVADLVADINEFRLSLSAWFMSAPPSSSCLVVCPPSSHTKPVNRTA